VKYDAIQTAFNGGEISPRLHGRVETDLYKKAVKQASNWEPTPQGSAMLRSALWYRRTLAAGSLKLLGFEVSQDTGYLIELRADRIVVYDQTTLEPVDFGGMNMIINPDFTGGGEGIPPTGWLTGGPIEFASGVCKLFRYADPPGYPAGTVLYGSTYQVVTGLLAGTYTLNFDITNQDVETLKVTVWQGTNKVFEELITIEDPDDTTRAFSFPVTLPVAGNIEVHFAAEGDSLNLLAAPTDNISIRDPEFLISSQEFLVAPWTTAAQVLDIEALPIPSAGGDKILFYGRADVVPHVLSLFAGVWKFERAIFTGLTLAAYPTAADYFQGRLWLATLDHVYGSKSGVPFDFTVGSNANDGISVDITTKGWIRWLFGHLSALLIGTDRGEYHATGGQSIIVPPTPLVRTGSGFGSSSKPALLVGSNVVFVSADRRKLFAAAYSGDTENWEALDLASIAEHLTKPKIKEVHYYRDPKSLLVCIFDDGTCACCTIDRSNQIVAWWRFATQGSVRSAAVLGSKIYFIVARERGVFLEELDIDDDFIVRADSLVEATVETDPTVGPYLDGYTHSSNTDVKIYADGVEFDGHAAADGYVPIPEGFPEDPDKVYIGIAYPRSVLITLPPEGGNPRGTSQGSKKRWVEVVLRINNSAFPLVNGYRAAEREPDDAMDEATPLRVVDCKVEGLTYEATSSLTIEQDVGLRTEILAIFGGVGVNSL
jgi:hypothetical protein